jgi:hypothetical protein
MSLGLCAGGVLANWGGMVMVLGFAMMQDVNVINSCMHAVQG